MKVAIVGVTGYSGLELVRILEGHPLVEIVFVHATKEIGQELSHIYPHLTHASSYTIEAFDAEKIMATADLVFFATPSGIAKDLSAPFVAKNFPLIDLSGDHRLPAASYGKWYHKPAAADELIEQFTYGLSEFADLQGKRLIANPGCYATATELALIPLLMEKKINPTNIIVDAKSGLSGAGKALTEASHFVQAQGNYVTYKLNQHQHIPEIVQTLQVYDEAVEHIQFSTSLLPLSRGIVATLYLTLTEELTEDEIFEIYEKVYRDKPFVRVRRHLPNLHQVVGSNYTDIGFAYNPVTKILTVVAVLDNLVKGAAGQAVQNMNLMFGFDETTGLLALPTFI